MPLVTVLMPVYNAERYVTEAVQSILQQSFTDFEFLIFDDGSTDGTPNALKSLKDGRIRLFRGEKNTGYIERLNQGIILAQGKYIARIDADDVALPTRLEKQFNFLEQHLEYAVVGCSARILDAEDNYTGSKWVVYSDEELIRAQLLFQPPFPHPSVMVRTEVIREFGYNKEYYIAEDYHLWVQISQKYKIGNLTEELLLYRIHSTNSSTTQKQLQKESLQKIFREQLSQFGIHFSEQELQLHLAISGDAIKNNLTSSGLYKVQAWLLKLQRDNNSHKIYDIHLFQYYLGIIWFRTCRRALHAGNKDSARIYRKSSLYLRAIPKWKQFTLYVEAFDRGFGYALYKRFRILKSRLVH